MSAVDLSIITVGYKSCTYVRALLESLFEARGQLTIEYFILDNASNDGLIEMVEKEFVPRCDERLKIYPIQNDVNLGFAKANNIGLQKAQGRYILLLNPDMRLFSDSLTNLVAWMDTHTDAGIVGGRLLTPDGETVPHVRRFPRLTDQLFILLKIPHLLPQVLHAYLCAGFDYDAPARVDSIRGSFFAIRRETIQKIGRLDERYFIWFEEVDYCRKAAAANIQVWYTPETRAVDFVGRSFSLVGGYKKQCYFTRSMHAYFKKWHPQVAWIIGLTARGARVAARIKEIKEKI